MFSLICAWTNDWANNRDAGDLRRHRAHYDVTVMNYRRHRYCIWHQWDDNMTNKSIYVVDWMSMLKLNKNWFRAIAARQTWAVSHGLNASGRRACLKTQLYSSRSGACGSPWCGLFCVDHPESRWWGGRLWCWWGDQPWSVDWSNQGKQMSWFDWQTQTYLHTGNFYRLYITRFNTARYFIYYAVNDKNLGWL